jgi:hypothetical protein
VSGRIFIQRFGSGVATLSLAWSQQNAKELSTVIENLFLRQPIVRVAMSVAKANIDCAVGAKAALHKVFDPLVSTALF